MWQGPAEVFRTAKKSRKHMDNSPQLRVQIFEELPSAAVFASQIEPRNVPAVFRGCVKEWKAFLRWNPANGGLDYLQERAGSSVVEAMLSTSAPVFYGDLRSHERVPIPFSSFIGFCKQHVGNVVDDSGASSESERHQLAVSDAKKDNWLSYDAPHQIYLAQVPIISAEDQERVQLKTLREDIEMPTFLAMKELASINLWMNNAQARSSTHYDPHHNVLCIVSGCKQVVLWPPSASPMLYPMALYGEASNHSSVALENPDFSLYPRAKCFTEYSQKIILNAGDALFIPEGWFHQVDSDDLTIAVNFWWQSNLMSGMLEHMDAYYLRRILRRLTDKEMNQVLQKAYCPGTEKSRRHLRDGDQGDCVLLNSRKGQELKSKDQRQRFQMHDLEPSALEALHVLVSLVHDRVNTIDNKQSEESTSTSNSVIDAKHVYEKIVINNLFVLEDDSVAKYIWTLDALTLRDILLAIAHNFPRTLEALILHLLSPVGAEVLTRKFDEIDQQITEEDRNNFYRDFYGAFDDQFAAMDAILNGKESFARKAFKNVLDKYLGVNLDTRKPSPG